MNRILMAAVASFTILALASCSDNAEQSPSPRHEKKKKKEDLSKILTRVEKVSVADAVAKYIPGPGRRGNSPTASEYIEGAHLAFDNDDHEAALVLADRAVQISPGNGAAYYQRGKARFNTMEGDEDRALEDLEKSCRLSPGEDTAYIYIARIYDGRNQKKKALAALSEGIRVCPRKRDLYKYRAALYNEDGRIDLAEKDYNDYVATGGTSECFFLRGKFYEKCGRLENALRDYTTVIKRQNRRNQVDKLVLGYKYRAGVLRRLGRHREAIADLSEAFKGDPRDDEAIRLRGFEYIAVQDYKHALADFDKAIELAPRGRQGYEGRAAVYEKLGEQDLADRDRKEAEKLDAAPAELPI